MIFRYIIYPVTKKECKLSADLFWNGQVCIALPPSMDIFLLGCKTDDAEIRLTRYLLKHLEQGNFFVDIGSHIGYYSLLSSFCVGETGRVISVEASPATFSLLKKNVAKHKNIEAFNIALSDKEETTFFYEFAGRAEYNTTEPAQFEEKKWFSKVQYNKILVETSKGDTLMARYTEKANVFKIDVEGAENRVIAGLGAYLLKNDSVVVMEFVNEKRHNGHHIAADALLSGLGYTAFYILPDGTLQRINGDTGKYVEKTGLESDNIVYRKNFT
jgi:FkbM family methyltransferase